MCTQCLRGFLATNRHHDAPLAGFSLDACLNLVVQSCNGVNVVFLPRGVAPDRAAEK